MRTATSSSTARTVDLTRIDPSVAGAAGGGALVTTVQDVSHFLDALLKGRLFRHHTTLREMLSLRPSARPRRPGRLRPGNRATPPCAARLPEAAVRTDPSGRRRDRWSANQAGAENDAIRLGDSCAPDDKRSSARSSAADSRFAQGKRQPRSRRHVNRGSHPCLRTILPCLLEIDGRANTEPPLQSPSRSRRQPRRRTTASPGAAGASVELHETLELDENEASRTSHGISPPSSTALCRSLVILSVADGRRESAICRVPVQRASFRPAPPGDPSRCLSGDRELRPERHQ